MKAIVAMDPQRVIGYHDQIPWHLPEDMKWFKRATSDPKNGGYLIMGHTTYQLVGPLPNRFTYILTNDPNKTALYNTKFRRYVTLKELLALTLPLSRIWVVGGAKTYKTMLPYCQEVYVSHVMDEYEGDTYMPEFESMFPNQEIVQEHKDFWIVRHWRSSNLPPCYDERTYERRESDPQKPCT